jgi:hypothetical protein
MRELTGPELAGLITWLRAGHARGLQGLVLGLAELEASDRYVKDHPTEE